MTLLSVWGHVQRPWGYEIRVDFEAEDGSILNHVMNFDSEPDESDLTVAIDNFKAQLEETANNPIEEPAVPEKMQSLVDTVSALTSEKAMLLKRAEDAEKAVEDARIEVSIG